MERVLRGACVLALAALGLMSWSLFDPRPIPVVLAMSLGTLSLGAFLVCVVVDVRRRRATPKPQ
jgi:hypothetical protein